MHLKNHKSTLLFLFFTFSIFFYTKAQTLEEIEKVAQEGKIKKSLLMVNKNINDSALNPRNCALRSRILMYENQDQCWNSIQEGVQKFPNDAEVYLVRSQFYFELREISNALKDLDKSLELAQDDSIRYRIYLNRGSMNHFSGNNELAIDDCQKALNIRPDSKDALNNLSGSLFDIGKTDEAKSVLLKLKDIDSNYIGTYVNLGYQLQNLGKFEEAAKYLEDGLKVDPNEPYLWNNLGYAQFKMGKTEEAIKSVNKSIKINPNNSYCYRNLALIYLEKYDKTKACEQIKKALQHQFTALYGDEMELLRKQHCLN